MLHKNCMKFGTLNLKKVKVNGCKLSRNIINMGTLGKSFIWDAFEQEICVPSRSEYILLIVSRLGPPSVYDYWLSGYSLIISQKSITTSERMPEKINDSELPRDFLARLGCSRNQEWSREFQRCHKKALLHLAQAKPEYDKKSWNATHCPWQCTSCWREWWRRRVTSLQRTFNGNGICTFVFVYFHVRHPGTSFLRFSYNNLLKNIAYVMVYTLYKVVLPFAKGLFVPHGAIRFFSRIASTMAAYAHQPTWIRHGRICMAIPSP